MVYEINIEAILKTILRKILKFIILFFFIYKRKILIQLSSSTKNCIKKAINNKCNKLILTI